jgi:hypothetical protein
VNLARNAGLARDPDIADGVGEIGKKGSSVHSSKESRRMLWWEIMFYDTLVLFHLFFVCMINNAFCVHRFISDTLNQPASVSLSSYSTRWPTCASSSSSTSRKPSSSQRRYQPHIDADVDIDSDVDADFNEEDEQQQQHRNHTTAILNSNQPQRLGKTKGGKARGRAASTMMMKARQGGDNFPEVVFGVRCRWVSFLVSFRYKTTQLTFVD